MKAMILAAGRGTRLGKITEGIPKALVDINGKTALRIAVEKCTSYGFDEIIVNVHHFADLVEEEVQRLNESGFKVTVSDERGRLMETGGGLFEARSFFDRTPFLVYNVDIISDIDLTAFYRFHMQQNGIATLAVGNQSGNRVFLIDSTGLVKGWRNTATGKEILSGKSPEELYEVAFLGFHMIDPAIFNYMYEGVYSMTDLYLSLAHDHKIFTYNTANEFWGDIGSPESLEYVREHYKER
jgi:NDP-sugar pyrophosphorylase family protein